jgi:hypothetical protein
VTPHVPAPHSKDEAEEALKAATKEWRAAKKRERAARDELAAVVRSTVTGKVLSENKVASLTDIPRMTIRKMLGKS